MPPPKPLTIDFSPVRSSRSKKSIPAMPKINRGLQITTSDSSRSRSSRSSMSSQDSDTTSLSSVTSPLSIIQSVNLNQPLNKRLLEKYIDDIVVSKSREDVKPKVIDNMKSAFYKIYSTMTSPENYMINTNIEKEYINIKKTRQKQIQLITGNDIVFTTDFYTSIKTDSRQNPIHFLKVYNILDITSINHLYAIMSKLISEIYFNKRAYDIRKKCGLVLPKIVKYGTIKDVERNNIVKVYIIMEYIDIKKYNSISLIKTDDILIKFFKKLYGINKCLELNNIFHNDIHEENVFFKYTRGHDIGDILLIDYGESLARQDRLPDDKLRRLFTRFLPKRDFRVTVIEPYTKTASGVYKHKWKHKRNSASKRTAKLVTKKIKNMVKTTKLKTKLKSRRLKLRRIHR